MFVRKIQPWTGGGGGNNSAPPSEVIISNTLAVFPSGSDTEIELVNVYVNAGSPNPVIVNPFTNSAIFATSDFTLGPLPTGPNAAPDGSIINLRIGNENPDSDNIVMSIDSSILVCDQLVSLFPFTIPPPGAVYLSLEFDDSFSGQFILKTFVSVASV